VTGYINSELINTNIIDLHKPNLEKIGQNFELIPAYGSVTYEATLLKHVNESMPVEVHVSQITIVQEVYLQWILKDIREQKKVDQLREDLSAMLYHDLRSHWQISFPAWISWPIYCLCLNQRH